MVTKKDVVIAILSTFCLTATLFTIATTRGSPQGNLKEYYLKTLYEISQQLEDLEALIDEMKVNITELESELTIMNSTKLGKPDYDSFEEYGGWKYIEPDDHWRFDHELNTTNVLIYIVFSNDTKGTNINHRYYGTTISSDFWAGAWWCDLTNDYVMVHRYAESDECAYVRVMIWKIPD